MQSFIVCKNAFMKMICRHILQGVHFILHSPLHIAGFLVCKSRVFMCSLVLLVISFTLAFVHSSWEICCVAVATCIFFCKPWLLDLAGGRFLLIALATTVPPYSFAEFLTRRALRGHF